MLKLAVLCIIPLVLCAPQKRFIESFGLHLPNAFDMETLRCDMQIMVDALGSDPTEHACEAECHKVIQDGNILTHSCPLVCHAFQNLVHYFDTTPETGNVTCNGGLQVGK